MKKFNIWLLIALFSFIFFSGFQEQSPIYALENNTKKIYCDAELNDDFAEDRVLIVLNEEASLSSKVYSNLDFARHRCEDVDNLTSNAMDLSLNKRENKRVLSLKLANSSKEYVLEVIDELIKRDDVLYAGPDYKVCIASTTSNDSNSDLQWAINNIQLPQVWDFTIGSADVMVGVMDTGIDGTHPDLEASIIKNMCRDFTSGKEVVVTNPIDPHGHGTHVAGIIGAIGNNNTGVTGINWNVGLVSLRVFDSYGNGYASYVAEAIKYANNNNIPILNLSGRWYGKSANYDVALNTIIETYSGLLVCAAGNEERNNDGNNPAYPASYRLSNLISAGSIDSNSEKSSFSNYGLNSVDIFAPGRDIYSTTTNGRYKYSSGTSMATPHVSGVAALLLSINPNLTTAQLKEAIVNSVDIPNVGGVNPLEGLCVTNGRLNAYNAIQYILRTYALDGYSLRYGTAINIDKTIDASGSYFVEKNAMIRLSKSNYSFGFTISSNSPINVVMYNQDFNEIAITKTTSNGGCEVNFNPSLTSGTYYLKVNYIDLNQSGTINISIHNHNYEDHYCSVCNDYTTSHDYHDPYTWVDYNQHKATCGCGATTQQGHAVASNAFSNGKRYATCLICGGLAERGFVELNALSTEVQYVTDNGSYILPNGVIVLVDEDIEAYMNQTLIFQKKNTNLTTE